MALDFKAVSLKTVAAKSTGKTYDDEFKAEYAEAMQYILNEGHDALEVEFPDATTRDKWFNTAKSYGLTLDTPMNIRRIKGTDSDSKEHGRLTFTLETVAQKEANAKKAKESRERVEILKSYGHTIIKGKKTPEQVATEQAILNRHYAKKDSDQETHLAKYRESLPKK